MYDKDKSNKISIYCHSKMHCKSYTHCQGLYYQKWNTHLWCTKLLFCIQNVMGTNSNANLSRRTPRGLTLVLCTLFYVTFHSVCQIIWYVGTRSIIPFWFAYLCIFCQLYRCETVDIGPSQVLFTSSCWLVWRTDRHRSDSQETISKVTLNKTFTRKKFFPPLPQRVFVVVLGRYVYWKSAGSNNKYIAE